MSENYYTILGVERSATQAEINKAYCCFNSIIDLGFQVKGISFGSIHREINESYKVLSDQRKRAIYDSILDRIEKGGSLEVPEKKLAYFKNEKIFDEIQQVVRNLILLGPCETDPYPFFKQLCQLLSAENIALINKYSNPSDKKVIIRDLMGILQYFPFPYSRYLTGKMMVLAGTDERLKSAIRTTVKTEKFRSLIKRYGWGMIVAFFALFIFTGS